MSRGLAGISGDEALQFVLKLSLQSIKRIASYAEWAINYLDGRDDNEPRPVECRAIMAAISDQDERARQIAESMGRPPSPSAIRVRAQRLIEHSEALRQAAIEAANEAKEESECAN